MPVSAIRLCERMEMLKQKLCVIDGRLPLSQSIAFRELVEEQINVLSYTLDLWWSGKVPGRETGTDEDEHSEKKWEDMWRSV